MAVAIIITFILGYAAIALEHIIRVNKAASALLTGVICWTIYILFKPDHELVNEQLMAHLGEVAGILFFLLSAMTIVELVDSHDGFQVITERIKTKSARKLIWITGLLTFFLSALLDNLTTTIVIVSLIGKLVADKQQRLFFCGITVVAANAGGAWSPLGDVTTTMLWIGGQITPVHITLHIFLPSLFCLLVPLTVISCMITGKVNPVPQDTNVKIKPPFERRFAFLLGIGTLASVPLFKIVTGLPPFMGILLGLSIMWIIIEIFHNNRHWSEEKTGTKTVVYALRKIDSPSILFFLGILLSIAALQATGQLGELSDWLAKNIRNETVLLTSIGLISSIIDNVPLVSAVQGMYSLDQYPPDDSFWEFLAYAAGTGGSALIIGSAAGIAAMGMEKISFFWYLRRISWLALIGYFAGIGVYLLQEGLFK